MSPRYYQQNAVNRTVEAIAKNQNRILLVMATGTGKTYTAKSLHLDLITTNINAIFFLISEYTFLKHYSFNRSSKNQ